MFLIVLLVAVGVAKHTSAPYFYKDRPLIIAHRGACGYIPEHTLQSYQVAAYMGADFIEPDVIVTKDGKLIINHDSSLNSTTDISQLPEFRHLLTTKVVTTWEGDQKVTGWFAEDLTFKQVQKLRVRQRLPYRVQSMNDFFSIPSLEEALEWVIQENQQRKAVGQELLGAYIELKYPTYYSQHGFDVVELLMEVLTKYGIQNIAGAAEICPIILQCFELDPLVRLGTLTDLPLVYLMKFGTVDYNITEYEDKVHGVGPNFEFIFDSNLDSTGFVKKAQNLELAVHPWVVRDDDLPYSATIEDFYAAILEEQFDGVFTEFPDTSHYYFELN